MSFLLLLLNIITYAHAGAATPLLWLPLGDSITWGCVGPTIEDCRPTSAGYRIALANALSQPSFGDAATAHLGYDVTTMGSFTTGPSYVPTQWTKNGGYPGWQFPQSLNETQFLLKSGAQLPDLITIHLGTNDCAASTEPADIADRARALLAAIFELSPASQVFMADVISTGLSFNACIDLYNPMVPTVVAEYQAKGMKIWFVPMHDSVGELCAGAVGNYANLCGAGTVHPTTAGYPRMASAFALTILENLISPPVRN